MDLKLQVHHQRIQHGHPMLWYPEDRVGSWMKFIFPMPNPEPVQTYSLNFRKQKEENLAWHSRRLASRRLVRPMFQVRLAPRKVVRTPSVFFTAKRPRSHKEPFLRPKGSGKLFLPIHLMEERCQQLSPKWLQEITIKVKDNLTQRFIGTREGRYCWKRSQNMEHEISLESIVFDLLIWYLLVVGAHSSTSPLIRAILRTDTFKGQEIDRILLYRTPAEGVPEEGIPGGEILASRFPVYGTKDANGSNFHWTKFYRLCSRFETMNQESLLWCLPTWTTCCVAISLKELKPWTLCCNNSWLVQKNTVLSGFAEKSSDKTKTLRMPPMGLGLGG